MNNRPLRILASQAIPAYKRKGKTMFRVTSWMRSSIVASVLAVSPVLAMSTNAADHSITWQVGASSAYAVTANGTKSPTITFRGCLTPGTTYRIDLAATIVASAPYTAQFGTTGEDTQVFGITFAPTGASGHSTQTVHTTLTVRTPERAVPNRQAFDVLLEQGGGPLDTPFPAVVIPCVGSVAPTSPPASSGSLQVPAQLPNTGSGGMARTRPNP